MGPSASIYYIHICLEINYINKQYKMFVTYFKNIYICICIYIYICVYMLAIADRTGEVFSFKIKKGMCFEVKVKKDLGSF